MLLGGLKCRTFLLDGDIPRSFGAISYKLIYVVGFICLDKSTFLLSRDVGAGIFDSRKAFIDPAIS